MSEAPLFFYLKIGRAQNERPIVFPSEGIGKLFEKILIFERSWTMILVNFLKITRIGESATA